MFYWLLIFLVASANVFAINIGIIGDSNSSEYFVQENELYYRIVEKNLLSDGYEVKFFNAPLPKELARFCNSLSRLIMLDKQHELDIVVITLGINDAGQKEKWEDCAYHLLNMAEYCNYHGIELLVGTVDVSYQNWPHPKDFLIHFREVYDYVAHQSEMQLFPFIHYGFMNCAENQIGDMVHASAVGHRVWSVILEYQLKLILKKYMRNKKAPEWHFNLKREIHEE